MEETETKPRRRHPSQLLSRQQDCDYVVKVVLLGDLGVGKTSLIHTFQHGAYPSCDAAHKHGHASVQKVIQYCEKKVQVSLWDTAGQERYRSLTASYYRGAHACIVMYDVSNEESFDNVTSWIEAAKEFCETNNMVIAIVGNCSNCTPDTPIPVKSRRISHSINPFFNPHQQQLRQPPQSGDNSSDAAKRQLLQQQQSKSPISTQQSVAGEGLKRVNSTLQQLQQQPQQLQQQPQQQQQQPQQQPQQENGETNTSKEETAGEGLRSTGSDVHRALHQQERSQLKRVDSNLQRLKEQQNSQYCPTGKAVDRHRALNLAAQLEVSHFELDLRNNPEGLSALINNLVTKVITKAMEDHGLSITIKRQLKSYHKGTQWSQLSSKCSACCRLY